MIAPLYLLAGAGLLIYAARSGSAAESEDTSTSSDTSTGGTLGAATVPAPAATSTPATEPDDATEPAADPNPILSAGALAGAASSIGLAFGGAETSSTGGDAERRTQRIAVVDPSTGRLRCFEADYDAADFATWRSDAGLVADSAAVLAYISHLENTATETRC